MERHFSELVALYAQLMQQQKSVQHTSQLVLEKIQHLGNLLALDVTALRDLEPSVPREIQLPEHVSVQWAADYLGIHRSNFYRNVDGQLLFRVLQIGIRPYYLKSDVIALMAKHENGAHTFSKMVKKKKG